ncbi:hypothetical protein GGI35DRAFT_485139 [Trichoderma velutinum]
MKEDVTVIWYGVAIQESMLQELKLNEYVDFRQEKDPWKRVLPIYTRRRRRRWIIGENMEALIGVLTPVEIDERHLKQNRNRRRAGSLRNGSKTVKTAHLVKMTKEVEEASITNDDNFDLTDLENGCYAPLYLTLPYI